MASIKDVARQAGVAISTVSKVLNGYEGVSESTKDKVNAAIEALNYTPNAVAAALSSKQFGRVALLLKLEETVGCVDEINLQYLSGAIHRAKELKLDVVTLFFSMVADMGLDELTSYLKAQSVEGIIAYGMNEEDEFLRELIASGAFKIVLVDAPYHDRNTSSVWIDQKNAQYEIAKKTILGNESCTKVLYIAGDKKSFVTGERIAGMKKLAEELALELTIEYGDFSEKKARELTFSYADRMDVFVCASDLMAIGAMRAFFERGLRVPEDISVVGFDGIDLGRFQTPSLTTLAVDARDFGEKAFELLYASMTQETTSFYSSKLKLIQGESTAQRR